MTTATNDPRIKKLMNGIQTLIEQDKEAIGKMTQEQIAVHIATITPPPGLEKYTSDLLSIFFGEKLKTIIDTNNQRLFRVMLDYLDDAWMGKPPHSP